MASLARNSLDSAVSLRLAPPGLRPNGRHVQPSSLRHGPKRSLKTITNDDDIKTRDAK